MLTMSYISTSLYLVLFCLYSFFYFLFFFFFFNFSFFFFFFFFQAEDGIRDLTVTGVQTCALPIYIAVENLSFVLKRIFPLITSLFCQKAALAIPTLALISSSHLASSDIQLPDRKSVV